MGCEKCSSPGSSPFTFHYGRKAGEKKITQPGAEAAIVAMYRADALTVALCKPCVLLHARKMELQQVLFGFAGVVLLGALAVGSVMLVGDYPTGVGSMSREESTKRAFFFGAAGFLALGAFGATVAVLRGISFFLLGAKRREATCLKEQYGERLAILLHKEALTRQGATDFWTPTEYKNPLRANIRETVDPLEFSVWGGEAKGA